MSTEDENMKKFMDAFNDRQITDEDGNVVETEEGTSESEPSTDEAEVEAETSEDESTQGENPDDEEESESQPDEAEIEEQPVEEESGKRTVPIDRFKSVYGKQKAAEREAEALKRELESLKSKNRLGDPEPQPVYNPNEALERELLFDKYPQFDPSNEEKYSDLLDQMGAEIYSAAGGTITKLEAARRALARQAEIAKQVGALKAENTTAKKQVADSGVSTSASRGSRITEPNFDAMSDKEMEAYMRANGIWS